MFEFLCDRVIPGCTHRETGDTPEAVRQKAIEHLHDHDGMEYLDRDTEARLSLAILPIEG
jgi:predicted small metal-binding protein